MLVLLSFIILGCSKNKELSQQEKTMLIRVVDSMHDIDQEVRLAHYKLDSLFGLKKTFFINNKKIKQEVLGSKFESYEKSVDSIWVLMKENDKTNTKLLLELTDKFGFPSSERLGVYKSKAYWIFVHTPSEDFEAVERVINEEFELGRISEYKKEYIFWHLNGRNGMPPRLGSNGEVIW